MAAGAAGAALVLASGLAVAASTAAGAATSPAWSQATGITLPTGAYTKGGAQLLSVTCTGAGLCAAVGQYQKTATSGAYPMVVTTSTGGSSWHQAAALVLPKSAAAVPNAVATSVSCTSSTSCEAVGRFHYAKVPANNNGFISDLTSTGWTQARTMPQPANAASPVSATLSQVSCSSPGNCGAIGTYTDNKGDLEVSAFIETAGKWGTPVQLKPPADAPAVGHQNVQPFGISCPAAGACVAVGKYFTKAGDIEPFRATATGGKWAQAVRVALPADAITGKNQQGDFHAVYCTAVGNCLAVGNYRTAVVAHSNAVYSLRETGGTWPTRGTEFKPKPANAANPVVPQDNGVACPVAGSCVTAGFYTATGGLVEPLSDAYTGTPTASWQAAAEVLPPADSATAPPADALLRDVACWAAWKCVAVGSYLNKSGHMQALVAAAA